MKTSLMAKARSYLRGERRKGNDIVKAHLDDEAQKELRKKSRGRWHKSRKSLQKKKGVKTSDLIKDLKFTALDLGVEAFCDRYPKDSAGRPILVAQKDGVNYVLCPGSNTHANYEDSLYDVELCGNIHCADLIGFAVLLKGYERVCVRVVKPDPASAAPSLGKARQKLVA